MKAEHITKLFDLFSRLVFAVAALILMLLAIVIIVDVVAQLASTLLSRQGVGIAALSGIGYVVVAIAVFDVAKYLIDEEVVRAREMRAAGETRRSSPASSRPSRLPSCWRRWSLFSASPRKTSPTSITRRCCWWRPSCWYSGSASISA